MKNTKTKVLILSTKVNGGGAEKVSTLMGENINNSRLVVFENIENFEYRSDNLVNLNTPRYSSSILKIVTFIVRFIRIQYLKLIENPGTTVSHLEGPNFINLLTFLGGKKVIFVHNINSINYLNNEAFGSLKLKLMKFLYKRADLVIGVSNDICEELNTLFYVPKNKIAYMPNPIDIRAVELSSKKVIPAELQFLDGEEYLINIGSLTEQKGQVYFLKILEGLKNTNAQLKGLILGVGKLEKELIDCANELNLKYYVDNSNNNSSAEDSDVIFLGFQSNPYPYLLHAKFFVMTSLWEGLPISLLESIVLKTPVIVSDCSSGIRQVLSRNALSKHINTPFKVYAGCIMPKIKTSNFEDQLHMWVNEITTFDPGKEFINECDKVIIDFRLHKVLEEWKEHFS